MEKVLPVSSGPAYLCLSAFICGPKLPLPSLFFFCLYLWLSVVYRGFLGCKRFWWRWGARAGQS